MTSIIIFLWILFVVVLVSLLVKKALIHADVYSFQDWEKSDLPYITIDIQGHKLNMITDSAAAVSIITPRAIEQLEYEHSTRKVDLMALTEDGLRSEVVSIPFKIGNKEIKCDFVLYNGDDIAGFKKHGISIDGILGVEFFKKTGGKVDFKTQTVTFP